MSDDIKQLIKDAIDNGATKEEIAETLRGAGWDDNKIRMIFSELYSKEEQLEAKEGMPASSYQPEGTQFGSESQLKPESEKESKSQFEFESQPKPIIENVRQEEKLQPKQEFSPQESPEPPEPPERTMEFPRSELTGKENVNYSSYRGKTITYSTQEPIAKPTIQEQQYGQQQQQYSEQIIESQKDKKNLATASLIFGILSIFTGLLGGVIGLILGIMGLKSSKRSLAVAGIIMSIFFGSISTIIIFILMNIVSTTLNTTQKIANAQKVMADMYQLRAIAQEHYSNLALPENNYKGSYEGLESNPKVLNIKKNIKQNGGEFFSINVSTDKYCAEVKLPNRNQWWCVDSNLQSRGYDTDPVCSKNKYTCE